MGGWWVNAALENGGWPLLISWIFWVIGSIVLHELAHGWTALRCGDSTPRDSGHMTWNPVVHMGWLSLALFAATGLAWGAMPVRPANFRGRYDDAKVSVAGPAMNLLLAMISLAGLIAFQAGAIRFLAPGTIPTEVWNGVTAFFHIGSVLNIALAIFNLVPIPPLDGSRILGSFVPAVGVMFSSEKGRVVSLILLLLLFTRGGGFAVRAGAQVTDAAARAAIPALAGGGGVGGSP